MMTDTPGSTETRVSQETQPRWTEIWNQITRSVCEVTFTKVDGTSRTLTCTLRSDLLPVRAVNENRRPRPVNYETITVWCPDLQDWRSFRVGNVTHIVALPGDNN